MKLCIFYLYKSTHVMPKFQNDIKFANSSSTRHVLLKCFLFQSVYLLYSCHSTSRGHVQVFSQFWCDVNASNVKIQQVLTYTTCWTKLIVKRNQICSIIEVWIKDKRSVKWVRCRTDFCISLSLSFLKFCGCTAQ